MPNVNRQITLASRPAGMPSETNFALEETPVPVPGEGEFLARIHWLSVDPYMRGRMSDRKSYARPVQIGEVMTGGAAAVVEESRHPSFAKGDWVCGTFGWRDYAVSDGTGVVKLDPKAAPPAASLGVLGMPGMTAYFCLLDLCKPKPGETVFISGAAGAVGSVAGQIAKLKGCRVAGSAGGPEKVKYLLEECGFDAAFDYKAETDYRAALKRVCPNGIDAYFDNVGGPVTDAVFPLLNFHARVAICGQIAEYNFEKPELGPRFLTLLIVTRATISGFLVSDYLHRWPEATREMAGWLREGKIKYRETVVEGLENAPKAFLGLFRGENLGKMLVKVV